MRDFFEGSERSLLGVGPQSIESNFLAPAAIDEHRSYIEEMEEYLRNFPNRLGEGAAPDLPVPNIS